MPLSLADQVEILELVARYNFAIDHLEAEAWADVFTDDGVLKMDDSVRAQGRVNLIAYIEARHAPGSRTVRHWTANHLIEGEGDHARLRAYIMSFDITERLEAPRVMGEYNDELVKVGGAWKFKTRWVRVVAIQQGLKL